MNIKKILITCLILMILSITAVSTADSDNINATDSIEPDQEVEPVKTVEDDNNLEPVSKNKPVDLSNIQTTSTSPGTFDDLQLEINNAEDGSVLVLTRDYTRHYGSRIHLDKDITIDGQGHTLDCLGEGGCSTFYSTTRKIVLKNIRIINGHNDYNDEGGALHIEGSAQYTLENCIFENNWADDYGGAIYNDGNSLTIKNCTFQRK